MAFNEAFTGYFDDIAHIGIPTEDLDASVLFWQSLGFKKIGEFDSDLQGHKVAFMNLKHLTIETWTGDKTTNKAGAINHISLDTSDARTAFKAAQSQGFKMLNDEVQELDFWQKGIRFFNIEGPNGEIVEFCEIVK